MNQDQSKQKAEEGEIVATNLDKPNTNSTANLIGGFAIGTITIIIVIFLIIIGCIFLCCFSSFLPAVLF